MPRTMPWPSRDTQLTENQMTETGDPSMIGTEARTMNGGTTGANETRHVAITAAERLGGPLENEQSRDTTSEAETDVGPRADFNIRTGVGSGAAAMVLTMQASGSGEWVNTSNTATAIRLHSTGLSATLAAGPAFAVWGRTFD